MWRVKSQPPLCLAEDSLHSLEQWGLLGTCCHYSWCTWRWRSIRNSQTRWLITSGISPSVGLGIDARMDYIRLLLAAKPPWDCEAMGGRCTLSFLFPRRRCNPWSCGSRLGFPNSCPRQVLPCAAPCYQPSRTLFIFQLYICHHVCITDQNKVSWRLSVAAHFTFFPFCGFASGGYQRERASSEIRWGWNMSD